MSEAIHIEPLVDPPRRADNRCAQCGQPIKRPKVYQRGVDRQQYDDDPFCSTPCCKAFWGVDISVGHFRAQG